MADNKPDVITKETAHRAIRRLIAVLVVSSLAALYLYSISFVASERISSRRFEDYIFHFEDYMFRFRHWVYQMFDKKALWPRDVVLTTIDEESYKKLERRWPWGRDVFAELVDKLSGLKPKVIALDFALYGESPGNPSADTKLAKAIEEAGNVIVASVYGKEKLYLGPYDIFAKASAGYGVIGAIRDSDNSIRKIKTFALVLSPIKGGDISFEVKAAARYLGVTYDKMSREKNGIVLGDERARLSIPADEDGYLIVNYLSDDEDIRTVSVWKIMSGEKVQNSFEGKLVLVSQTAEIFHDMHQTPFGYRSGGLIIANVLESILSSSYLRRVNVFIYAAITSLIYLVLAVIFYRTNLLKGFYVLAGCIGVISISSAYLFFHGLMWPSIFTYGLLCLLFLGVTFHKYGIMVIESSEIKRMAITHTLTGLYTHRYFRFLLEHTVSKMWALRGICSLVLIKIINLDRIIKDLSYAKGQMVQKKIADLIKAKLVANSSGIFLGISEFAMLMPGVGLYEALGIAGSLRDNICNADFDILDDKLRPAVAIGVSAFESGKFPRTASELMRSAKAALGRAKDIGLNKVCRFNSKIDKSVFEPSIIEKEIKQHLDDELGFVAMDLEERNTELEELLRQLSMTQRDLEQAHFETLRSLVTAIEQKDPCTAGHSERVGEYTEKIGRKLRVPEEDLRMLKQAGVLHDIGKIGVPADVLRKESGLTDAERHVIELHPEFSVRILSTSKYFNKILHAIRGHHEKLDGSGYPRGLKKGQISLEAQIIAVADVFDALSTDRPYKKALTYGEAINSLIAQPEKYNANIIRILKNVLEEEARL